jgi:hypothetical protein
LPASPLFWCMVLTGIRADGLRRLLAWPGGRAAEAATDGVARVSIARARVLLDRAGERTAQGVRHPAVDSGAAGIGLVRQVRSGCWVHS